MNSVYSQLLRRIRESISFNDSKSNDSSLCTMSYHHFHNNINKFIIKIIMSHSNINK